MTAPTLPVRMPALLRELAGLGATLALAQLLPVAVGFYLARSMAQQGGITFAAYATVNAGTQTLLIAAGSLLQALYYLGGRALGRDAPHEYGAALRAGVVLAVALGCAALPLCLAAGPLLRWSGMAPVLIAQATLFAWAAVAGLLPALLLVVFRIHAALQEHAARATALMAAGAAITVLLGAWIARHGGMHAPLGLALAPVLVNWLVLVCAGWWCMARLPLPAAGAGAALVPAVRELLRVGAAIGLVVLLDNLAALVSSLWVARYWLPLAPLHATAWLWVNLGMIVPLGLAQAVMQRVARHHARQDFASRDRLVRAAMLLAAGYGVLALAVFSAWPLRLAGLLLPAAQLPPGEAAALMLQAGLLLALQALVVVGAAALRGVGLVRAPVWLAVLGYGVVAGGAQWLLGVRLGGGTTGIWTGLNLGVALTAAAVLWHCVRSFVPAAPAAIPSYSSQLTEEEA
jgi:multidrug resistance protein, MATE family